jgi:hypothetical protein
LCHHPSDACGLYSFGAFKRVQAIPFHIFFGMLFNQWARKLAASPAIAEIFGIKAGLDFAFQAGFGLAVISNQTSAAWIFIFLAADAIDSAWSQQFRIYIFGHLHVFTLIEIFI